MSAARPHALLWGLAEPRQARELAYLPIDGVILAIGEGALPRVSPAVATAILEALPPFCARYVVADPGCTLPLGVTGVVDGPCAAALEGRAASAAPREPGLLRIARLPGLPDAGGLAEVLHGAAAAWLQAPAVGATVGAACGAQGVAADAGSLAALARRVPLLLDEAWVEAATVVPAGIVYGRRTWFGPGIIDLDVLEEALG